MQLKKSLRTQLSVIRSTQIALPCLLLTLSAQNVIAQPDSDDKALASATNRGLIEEVIVYARRREEPSQSVPIALDVIDAEAFFQRGLYSLRDVTEQSASVYLEQGSVPQDMNLTIRGLAPTRGRPNMAILLDGIDITTESMITSGGSLLIDPMLFDIEQIEVVKGPQHALYGRSAFAGAISYQTRAPGDEFTATVETDLGEFGQRMLRGRASGPLIKDTLSAGVSAATWSHDGFFTNPNTGSELGDRSGNSFAGTFLWTPGDQWSIQGRVSFEDSEFGIQAQAHPAPSAEFAVPASALGTVVDPRVTSVLGVRGLAPKLSERDISNSDNPRTPGQNYPGSSQEVLRTTLNITREIDQLGGLGPAQFISLTHLASADSFQFQDFNVYGRADERPAFGEIWIDNDTALFSQEFRLQSAGNGPFTWTVGAEYWEENRDVLNGGVTCLTYAPPFVPAAGAPACGPIVAAIGTTLPRNSDLWTRDIEHWAAFGLLGWEINDNWEVTVEARYVDEDLEIGGPDLDNSIVSPLPFLGGASFPRPAGLITARQSDSFIAPKATMQYTPNDDLMGYFSIAQGTKPAGISTVNGGGGTFVPEQGRFDREEVIVYELGLKTDLLNQHLRVNAAAFYQDFTDKQVTGQVVDENGFLQSRILNADAEVYGAELDITWFATDSLRLQAGYTFLETEFTDFTQLQGQATQIAYAGGCEVETSPAGQPTCRVSYTGNELERAPRNSFVGIANYSGELSAGINWFAELQATFRDERYSNQANQLKFDSYWLADMRLGLRSGDWEVIAYAENLLDDDTIRDGFNTGGYLMDFSLVGGFILPDSAQFYLPTPRTFGIRASYSFGG